MSDQEFTRLERHAGDHGILLDQRDTSHVAITQRGTIDQHKETAAAVVARGRRTKDKHVFLVVGGTPDGFIRGRRKQQVADLKIDAADTDIPSHIVHCVDVRGAIGARNQVEVEVFRKGTGRGTRLERHGAAEIDHVTASEIWHVRITGRRLVILEGHPQRVIGDRDVEGLARLAGAL